LVSENKTLLYTHAQLAMAMLIRAKVSADAWWFISDFISGVGDDAVLPNGHVEMKREDGGKVCRDNICVDLSSLPSAHFQSRPLYAT
jgi:hypothetical protein